MLRPLERQVSLLVRRAIIKAVKDSAIQTAQVTIFKDDLGDKVERFQEYGFSSVPLPGAEAIVAFMGGDRSNGVIIAVEDRRYRVNGLAGGEVALFTDEGDMIHFKRGNVIDIKTNTLNVIAENEVNIETQNATVTADNVDVSAESAQVEASTSASLTSPQVTIAAATKITATTPLLEVSGVISCAGIAAGGATPVPGKAVVQGSVEATGEVQDSVGTMAAMRSTYNSHTHGAGPSETPAPNQQM